MLQGLPSLPWWKRGTTSGARVLQYFTQPIWRSEAPCLSPDPFILTQRILTPCSQRWEA